LEAEGALVPMKYDAALFRVDALLGFSVFAFSRAVPGGLYLPLAVAYKAVPFVMTLWAGIHLTHPWGRFREFVTALAVAYGVGALLYLLVPACGPAYAKEGLASGQLMRIDEAPNAIPSLHMTTALVMFYFSRAIWRGVAAVFALVTASATIPGSLLD
jgi:hypothetical protein